MKQVLLCGLVPLVCLSLSTSATADMDLKVRTINLTPLDGGGYRIDPIIEWNIPPDHEGEFDFRIELEIWRGGQQLFAAQGQRASLAPALSACGGECGVNVDWVGTC